MTLVNNANKTMYSEMRSIIVPERKQWMVMVCVCITSFSNHYKHNWYIAEKGQKVNKWDVEHTGKQGSE